MSNIRRGQNLRNLENATFSIVRITRCQSRCFAWSNKALWSMNILFEEKTPKTSAKRDNLLSTKILHSGNVSLDVFPKGRRLRFLKEERGRLDPLRTTLLTRFLEGHLAWHLSIQSLTLCYLGLSQCVVNCTSIGPNS